MKSEIRKDYIQEKYVIIAPRRGYRRHELEMPAPQPPKFCVLCPEKVDKEKALLTLGPKYKNWRIKIVPNKYPAVSTDNPKAYGHQEVVIETPDHAKSFEELSQERIAELFKVYAKRTVALSKDKKIEYILIFKNTGGPAGASLFHSHSQIFATTFLPPHLLDKSQKIQEYKLKYGTCVYDDVIAKEKNGPRRVYLDKNIIAFTPYASMHSYEIWIMPMRHLDNVSVLNDKERLSWAKVLKKIVTALGAINLPYNYYFHQVIHDEDQHLYMKITPRGSIWAGVEIGSGIIINPIPPEEAAKFYRDNIK